MGIYVHGSKYGNLVGVSANGRHGVKTPRSRGKKY